MEATIPSQILLFDLQGEQYAFDVLHVREVVSMVKVTPLPSSLDFMAGVINLRGSVIPVVDLRRKFQFPPVDATADTSIVLAEIHFQQELVVIGAIVDAVRGVVSCEPQDVETAPKFGMKLNSNLVQAIAKREGIFVIVLDVERVFSEDELWLLQQGGTPGGKP